MVSERGFSHLNEEGEVHMVNVGDKEITERIAVAEGLVAMSDDLASRFFSGDLPKGDAAAVARVAGIQGAKKTPDLIPLCHPIPLTGVDVSLERVGHGVKVIATVSSIGRTGVEMEAMTAVVTASLAIYDMVKGLEREVTIDAVRLLEKSGGRSGTWHRSEVVE